MNKSEELLSKFSKIYFFEEFVQDNLQFSENNGDSKELADLILNLEDVVIAIQMKERSDGAITMSELEEKKWFDNKTREAKKQIKTTIDFIKHGKIPAFLNKRGIEIKIRKDAEIIPLIIFKNKSITDYPRMLKKHSETGLDVNCMSLKDFEIMCSMLISPGEIIDYLKYYRGLFYEVARSPEYKSIVSYFLDRYGEVCFQENIARYEAFREFVQQTAERSIVGRDAKDTYEIILLMAHFRIDMIKAFVERVNLAKEKAKRREYGRIGSLRDDRGEKFVVSFESSQSGLPYPCEDLLKKCAEKNCKFRQLLQVVVWWENTEKYRIDYVLWKGYNEDKTR